jgi:hypothetical protein
MLQPARIWLSSANACEDAEQLAHWQTQLAGIVTVNGAIFHGYLQSAVLIARYFYLFDFG